MCDYLRLADASEFSYHTLSRLHANFQMNCYDRSLARPRNNPSPSGEDGAEASVIEDLPGTVASMAPHVTVRFKTGAPRANRSRYRSVWGNRPLLPGPAHRNSVALQEDSEGCAYRRPGHAGRGVVDFLARFGMQSVQPPCASQAGPAVLAVLRSSPDPTHPRGTEPRLAEARGEARPVSLEGPARRR